MKISISGVVGSGKSTISKMVSDSLELEYFSVGGIMREMAGERGVSLQEFSEIAKGDKEIDFELDKRQKDLNLRDGFVVDSRLGFHFVPDSFKVFLKVDLNEAARRIFEDGRVEENYESIEECLDFLKKRIESESLRYKDCYGIDFPNEEVFDLVVDTTSRTPEEIVGIILGSVPNKDSYEREN